MTLAAAASERVSPIGALRGFLATLVTRALPRPEDTPLRGDDGTTILDHLVTERIRQNAPAVLRVLGDRFEMLLQPALRPAGSAHPSPLQDLLRRLLPSSPADDACTGPGFYTTLFHALEKELGLLLRVLYIVPAGAAHSLVVPVFRVMSPPVVCTFDEEVPAVAFGFLVGAALCGPDAAIVGMRTYDDADSHWTKGSGGERAPRLRAWGLPARCPAPQWLAASWVDPQCHMWPVGADPSSRVSRPAYTPTHYWVLPDASAPRTAPTTSKGTGKGKGGKKK